jgi:hypothetical protein
MRVHFTMICAPTRQRALHIGRQSSHKGGKAIKSPALRCCLYDYQNLLSYTQDYYLGGVIMKKFKALCFLFAVCSASLFAQNSTVENEGTDCTVNLPQTFSTSNAKLPDPFKKLDGNRISAKEDWKCRRQEILRLAERTVYGEKPAKPASVTGTVSNTSITVNVTEGSKNASFSASVTLPNTGTAPYPAVILYGNSGADAATIRGQGVATINYTPTNVGAETGNRTKSGAFYNIYGTNSKTGTLIAWAWGVSRIIDVIEQSGSNILKADAIGVTGCSRYGKGPFVAGAFDQRIALVMPMESGTGGMNIMRGAYADRDQSGGTNGAQSPNSAFYEQPWLGDDFNSFMNNPSILPIDMHEVVAMIAPRGLLVLDKPPESSSWLNTQSSHAAALAGAEVYKALEVGSSLHYISNASGSHCQWNSNAYQAPVQDFIKKFLLKTVAATGNTPTFNAASSSKPNMANWVDWTTPDLSGSIEQSSSSSVQSSSSSSVSENTTNTTNTNCIRLPANPNPPTDPHNTCFMHTDNKCYVCDDSHQSNPSVAPNCRSTWIWNGENVDTEGNIGTWYKEVPCEQPAFIFSKAPLTHFFVQASGKTLVIETSSPAIVEVYDLKGHKVASFKALAASQVFDLSLPSGIYFAKVSGVSMQHLRFAVR